MRYNDRASRRRDAAKRAVYMIESSAIKLFECKGGGQDHGDKQADSTFWTGRDGQMCVQYFRPEADVFYPMHVHSEYTFVVCLGGGVVVKQMGQEQTIGPGEALFGNYGVPHSSSYRSQSGHPCETVSISLDRKLMASLTADFEMLSWQDNSHPAFLGKVQSTHLKDTAENIARELKGVRRGRSIMLESQAIRLLIEGIRLWPHTGLTNAEPDVTQRLPRREFIRAHEFMRGCRKENFRLQNLCRFLGSSEERFTRLFLASTRQTPASFYNRMLMDRACQLLAEPALSIKEISFELGFKTSSHFIAAFRRVHEVSPQRYRDQCNGVMPLEETGQSLEQRTRLVPA